MYAEKGNLQASKSQASDSFKRACFNWGIGRELYSAPFIWVPSSKVVIQKRGDKYYCNERFQVSSIEYNAEHEITGLVILDSQKQAVYEMKPGAASNVEPKKTSKGRNRKDKQEADGKPQSVSPTQMDAFQQELQRTGVTMEAVKERYQIDKPEEMSSEIYRKVMSALAKTKPVHAA